MQISEISYNTTESDIKKHLIYCGEIACINLWKDKKDKRAIAFVKFTNQEAFDSALELNHSCLKGKLIEISNSKSTRQEGSFKGAENSIIVIKFEYLNFYSS